MVIAACQTKAPPQSHSHAQQQTQHSFQAASTFDCTTFFQFGNSIEDTRKQFVQSPETMAWNWFVCLNQFAGANRVWEALKPTDQVFLPNGAAPLPYAQRTATPAEVISKARNLGMNPNDLFHNLDSIQQVDGLIVEMGGQVPSAQRGQAVRFQLLMGQDTFNYINQKQVYNINGQAALTSDLNFPATSWELKTAWLWIGTDSNFQNTLQADGYYIVQAYYLHEEGYQVGYAALSGMHVINKLEPNWVWTTFENKNNRKYTVTNAIPPASMTNLTGPTAAAKTVNTSFQAKYPQLAQYELIGVQSQAGQPPILLANSQLESAFQTQSSCLACHGTAAYSAQKGYFNFALNQQGGIVYPTQPLPASAFAGYNRLDFVWSLKRAQWQR
jgi:hypothetical protein